MAEERECEKMDEGRERDKTRKEKKEEMKKRRKIK